MNHMRAKQSEGYDIYDYASVNYNAGGGAEVAYAAGTQSRAAVPGLTLDSATWPVSETYPAALPFFPGFACPHDAQKTLVLSTTNCLIRLVTRNLVARWVAALAAGAPFSLWPIPTVQVALPANTWVTFDDKWAVLYVVGAPAAQAGSLYVKASG